MQFAGEPILFADDGRNIILIRALPSDYSRLSKILERLDNMPRQVLVEALVAEVTLTDDWSLGVEWFIRNHGAGSDGSPYTEKFDSNFNKISADLADFTKVGENLGFTYSIFSNNTNVCSAIRKKLKPITKIKIAVFGVVIFAVSFLCIHSIIYHPPMRKGVMTCIKTRRKTMPTGSFSVAWRDL